VDNDGYGNMHKPKRRGKMTIVITKPDRRKGLRTMQDIPKETFRDMSPKSQMNVLFDYQKGQTGILTDIFKSLNGVGGLIAQTESNKESLSKAWKVILILFPGTLTVIGIFIGILKFF